MVDADILLMEQHGIQDSLRDQQEKCFNIWFFFQSWLNDKLVASQGTCDLKQAEEAA